MLVCHGTGVDIEAGDHGITIKPRGFGGFLMRGATGQKFIAYSKISAVQLKAPGLTSGFIQFTLSGGSEKTGGIFEAVSDENSVTFTAPHLQEFDALRRIIIERSAGSPAPSAAAQSSTATELASLADLLARGLLTDEEFAVAKARLLGGGVAPSTPQPPRQSDEDEMDEDFLTRVDAAIERQQRVNPVTAAPARPTFGRRGR